MSRGRHRLRHGCSECDDVVPGLFFDFKDTRDVEGSMTPQERGVFRRDHPQTGQRFGSGKLDLEPLLEFIPIAPDGAHFGTRITRNQYAKTSVCLFCPATTRRGARPRSASDCMAPIRTISGWLLCSLK